MTQRARLANTAPSFEHARKQSPNQYHRPPPPRHPAGDARRGGGKRGRRAPLTGKPAAAYARGQAAVGGAEPRPQVHPGILRGVRAAAGLCKRGGRGLAGSTGRG
jgi:hypothetical protein